MRTIGFVHHTRCQPAIALATIEHSDGGGASLRSATSTIVRFLLRRTGRALASSPVIRSAISGTGGAGSSHSQPNVPHSAREDQNLVCCPRRGLPRRGERDVGLLF